MSEEITQKNEENAESKLMYSHKLTVVSSHSLPFEYWWMPVKETPKLFQIQTGYQGKLNANTFFCKIY